MKKETSTRPRLLAVRPLLPPSAGKALVITNYHQHMCHQLAGSDEKGNLY
jgi:hypothetical protein